MIDAVELLAPVNDQPLGMHRIAPYYYFPGFNKPNGASELLISLPLWQSLTPSLQAVITAACHAEHDIALGEAEVANGRALGELVKLGAKPRAFPDDMIAAARIAAQAALARIGATSPLAGRIVTSYQTASEAARIWGGVSVVRG